MRRSWGGSRSPSPARRRTFSRPFDWPGNIRELQNLCARWAITVAGREIRPEDLPAHIRGGAGPSAGRRARGEPPRERGRDHPPDPPRDRWSRGGGGPAARHQQDDHLSPDETLGLPTGKLQRAIGVADCTRSSGRTAQPRHGPATPSGRKGRQSSELLDGKADAPSSVSTSKRLERLRGRGVEAALVDGSDVAFHESHGGSLTVRAEVGTSPRGKKRSPRGMRTPWRRRPSPCLPLITTVLRRFQ